MSLKEDIRRKAQECGIELVGFTTTEPFREEIGRMDALREHFERMGYGHTAFANDQFRMRLFPREFCPQARSLIVAAQPIPPGNVADKSSPGRPRGIVATNYARAGKGWYDVLEEKLDRLAQWVRSEGHAVMPAYGHRGDERLRVRPRYNILLRAAAVRAGIARRGRNTLVYTEQFGSWVVLSALYTDAGIPPDQPSEPESACGDCSACQEACPLGALNSPYVLDALRCMSPDDELRPSPRQPVPESERLAMGNRTGGCDICQSVCPKNRSLPKRQHALYEELDPGKLHPDLIRRLRESRRLPSALIVGLGNLKDSVAVEPLLDCLRDRRKGMSSDRRSYAAWALGRINDPRALAGLAGQLAIEHDQVVRQEIVWALGRE